MREAIPTPERKAGQDTVFLGMEISAIKNVIGLVGIPLTLTASPASRHRRVALPSSPFLYFTLVFSISFLFGLAHSSRYL